MCLICQLNNVEQGAKLPLNFVLQIIVLIMENNPFEILKKFKQSILMLVSPEELISLK